MTAGGITGLGILGWILASRSSGLLSQTRLYLAIFPAIVFLAGAGVQRMTGFQIPGVRLGRIARVLVAIVLWLNVLQVAARTLQTGAPRYHFGLISSQQYLEDNLGWYARAMEALRALPDGNRVVTLWEARGYYCSPVCESDEVLDRWVHQMRTRSNSETITDNWAEAGFSHLLVYRTGADFIRADDDRYKPSEWAAFEAVLERLEIVEDFGATYELYLLQP